MMAFHCINTAKRLNLYYASAIFALFQHPFRNLTLHSDSTQLAVNDRNFGDLPWQRKSLLPILSIVVRNSSLLSYSSENLWSSLSWLQNVYAYLFWHITASSQCRHTMAARFGSFLLHRCNVVATVNVTSRTVHALIGYLIIINYL